MAQTRTFTAHHVTAASPWDVYEALTDPDQQRQWRDRHAPPLELLDAQPYTRVAYTNGVVVEIEPEGSGTLMRAVRTQTGEGLAGQLGLRLRNRKAAEQELLAELKRLDMTVTYGDL